MSSARRTVKVKEKPGMIPGGLSIDSLSQAISTAHSLPKVSATDDEIVSRNVDSSNSTR